LHAQQDKKDTT